MWIDTHCHLDAAELAPASAAVRQAARQAGVRHCVLPAVEQSNWGSVRTLAHRHGDSYALGIHPLYLGGAGSLSRSAPPNADARFDEAQLQALDAALHAHQGDARLVAVGEIGLDGFVPGLDAARQEHVWRAQLALAQRYGLPVIVHVRRSADRLLKALRAVRVCGGIAHAFNGSLQQAQAFVDLGFKLGFGGAFTYPRALQLRRLAQALPLSALVLETDAPDIPPQWLYVTAAQRTAGQLPLPNSPAQLPRIGAELAQLRGLPAPELAQALRANACQALPRLGPLLAQEC